MTRTPEVLAALTPLIADLACDISADVRYQRLLDTLRRLLPCDAIALLHLEGETLTPLAIQGLSQDTLGRRFAVGAHPRLQAILAAPRAIRFPADCTLPDPYDGLVEGTGAILEVHDCMGCLLKVGQQTWGVLTLDALEAGRFSTADLDILDTFAILASATVAAAARFQSLTQSIADERRRTEAYRLAATPATHTLTGQSAAFRQMRSEIDLVAPSDLTVLITGETGVGKELIARELHGKSRRADKILVSINCAALPEHLVESELFGHVRGAFSGAVGDRPGKFEMAHGGTLFLDEIGELPMNAQAKLLRVLQDGQLQRLGSDRDLHADIRLIAATNRNLADEVRAGRFRADLYHRLSVFPLHAPPLRQRERDVLLLAGSFTEENRRRMGLRGLRLSTSAQHALQEHDWPGNVRELEYLIARAALKAQGRHLTATGATSTGTPSHHDIVTIDTQDLELSTTIPPKRSEHVMDTIEHAQHPRPHRDLRTEVDAFQKQLIEHSYQLHQHNLAATARSLGMDRGNLARLASRLGIIFHKH